MKNVNNNNYCVHYTLSSLHIIHVIMLILYIGTYNSKPRGILNRSDIIIS